jgi:uncharacterized protein YfiM (DUF2279 family)
VFEKSKPNIKDVIMTSISSTVRCACWTVSLFLLASCTTELNSVRVKKTASGVDPVAPAAGAPYFLTFTQFDVVVTRRVASCWDDDAGVPELKIAVEVKASRKEVRDPQRHYVIDFAELQSAFKNTDMAVEYYDTGGIKSVNVTAEDRSGQVISSVVSSAAKIVVGTVGVAGIASRVCEQPVADAVKAVAKFENEVKQKTKVVDSATVELERLTSMAAVMGKSWSTQERRAHANQISQLSKARVDLATATESLEEQLKIISIVNNVSWPTSGEVFDSQKEGKPLVEGLTNDQIQKWGSPGNGNLGKQTEVWARLESDAPARGKPCGEQCADDTFKGLKYRMPVPGRLVLGSWKTSADGKPLVEDVLTREEGMISQLGTVFTLPLRSTVFSNKTIVATFNEAGVPTKVGLKASASAEVAASTLASLVDSVNQVRKAKASSKLEEVKAETELLTAQKELDDAKKALNPGDQMQAEATSSFTADAALLQAELASIQARRALDDAKKQAGL